MEAKNNKMEHLLFETKGVVNFDPKNYTEVQPGIKVPLMVNIKSTLNNFNVRSRIVEKLLKRVDSKTICICGIESGGSYYASAVADILKKPLVLFRKKGKGYGAGERFVGTVPDAKDGLVTVIDDVIARGVISTGATKVLMAKGYRVEVITIFSFLPKMEGVMSKIKVAYLSDINNLLAVGRELNFFTESDIRLIRKDHN